MAADWESMTVAELDAVGDEYEDYPSSGNKADKVAWLSENVEPEVEEAVEEVVGEAPEEGDVAVPSAGPHSSEEELPLAEGQEVVPPGEGGEGAVPVVYAGTWVRLGETDNVPEECWGHVGFITFAPVNYVQSGELSPRPYEEQGEGKFIVHTRDQFGYDLQLEKDDFSAMSSAGRHEIISHG